MIRYLDSSVALAHLLAEDRFPPDELWEEQLVSSRLLECEVWNRINAHQLQNSHGEAARNLIGRIAMVEMIGPVLTRALQPFPVPVRTLNAIHLAALEFIRAQKQSVKLASYDERLLAAARLSRNFGVEREQSELVFLFELRNGACYSPSAFALTLSERNEIGRRLGNTAIRKTFRQTTDASCSWTIRITDCTTIVGSTGFLANKRTFCRS